MTEDEKMQVAVFRFGVISDFAIGAQMSRGEKRRLMRDKCSRKWQIPFERFAANLQCPRVAPANLSTTFVKWQEERSTKTAQSPSTDGSLKDRWL